MVLPWQRHLGTYFRALAVRSGASSMLHGHPMLRPECRVFCPLALPTHLTPNIRMRSVTRPTLNTNK